MSRQEADHLKQLQIWWLKRHGLLSGWRTTTLVWTNNWDNHKNTIGFQADTASGYMRLHYTQTSWDGNKESLDYKIPLTTSACNFGGVRYWFICPFSTGGKYCGRRVGVLYLADKYFACRYCNDLTYRSRNKSKRIRHDPLCRALDAYDEIAKISETMKREYYAGKPTKKLRKIERLEERVGHAAALLDN